MASSAATTTKGQEMRVAGRELALDPLFRAQARDLKIFPIILLITYQVFQARKMSGGRGGRIRTYECRLQKPVPYRLATPLPKLQRFDQPSPVAKIIFNYPGYRFSQLPIIHKGKHT